MSNGVMPKSLPKDNWETSNYKGKDDTKQFAGVLTIFAHQDHAWLAYTPTDDETYTVGTWGNKEHIGVNFNLEETNINERGAYDGRVSLTRNITPEQEETWEHVRILDNLLR